MPLTTDVTLPRGYKPVFPRRCVMCGCEPNSTISVAYNGTSLFWIILLPIVFLLRWRRLSIPICKSCKPKFFWQRVGRFVGGLAIAGLAAAIVYPFVDEWSRPSKRLALAVAMTVALVPYLLVLVLHPPCFDLTASGGEVEYEFASADYAEDFVALNKSHVLSSETTALPN